MSSRHDWGLLDVVDAYVAGDRRPHVWSGAGQLARVIETEARRGYGRQRLEQTLSDTRRQELASLLRYACLRAMQLRCESALPSILATRDGRRWSGSGDGFAASVEQVRAAWPEERLHELFEGWDEVASLPEASSEELALAAARLVDDLTSNLYLVYAHRSCGHSSREEATLRRLVDRSGRSVFAGYAMTSFARLLLAKGQAAEALASQREAARLGHLGVLPIFGWLTLSLRLGEVSDALMAFDRIAEHGDDAGLDELSADWGRSTGRRLSREARARGLKAAGALPKRVRHLGEVLFSDF